MAEKIVIAEIDVDVEALLKNTSDLKKALDDAKKAQSDLKKSGDTSSKGYVKLQADIKNLSKAYNSNVKAISENTQAVADLAVREELLNQVLGQEVSTIKEARAQNKLLNKLRNETNATTEEGAEQIKKLNEQLDRNNEFIKENADNYTKQKINIGNYKDSIKEAFDEMNIFNGGIGAFIVRSKEAGGAGKLFTSSLKGMTKGMIGLTKATLSFLLTPIGAVIGALGAAFLLVRGAMNKSEESTNKINKAFSGLTGMLKAVLNVLKPLADFLINGLVKGLEFVENAVFAVIDAFAWILDSLGFDEMAKSVKGFNKEVKEASKDAKDLADAEAKLAKAQRETKKTVKSLQKQQEDLRQIRDNETKSFKERIAANDKLAEKLKEQQKIEMQTAVLAVQVARAKIKANGKTKESLDELAEAELNLLDIKERINGIESEQLTNKNSLQKEGAEKAYDIALKRLEDEVKLYEAQQGVRAKTLQEELEIIKEHSKKEIDILDLKLKNKKISKKEHDAEMLNLKNKQLKKEIDILVDNVDRELQLTLDKNQQKTDSEEWFSEESLRIENERISKIEKAQLNAAKKKRAAGVINEQEYQDEITRIQKEAQGMRDEAGKRREEAIKEQQEFDLANKRELDLLNFQTEIERRQFELDEKRKQDVAAAEKVGADVSLVNKRYAKLQKQLNESVADGKKQINREAVGDIAGALGEETQLGKLAALTQAGINIQQGITKALALGGFAGIAKGVAVAATGARAVGRITGMNANFEKGGTFEVGGNRHLSGGTKFYGEDGSAFEAEKGEYIGVLSRNAVSGFEALNNELGNNVSLASLQQPSGVSQFVTNNSGIGVSEATAIVDQMMKNMPNPVVTVEDINTGQESYTRVVEGANLG